MWSDNESKMDLLGFQHLVGAVTSIVKNESLLPATIGIYGDWGSGKSSLLQMAKADIEQDKEVLVLSFNGWLFEGYNDAKTALMGAILDEIIARRKLTAQAKDTLLNLVRNLNLIQLAGVAGRLTAAYTVGGVPAAGIALGAEALKWSDELLEKGKKITPDNVATFLQKEDPSQNLRRSIRDFRLDFAKLLEETSIRTLVVVIDDLDRCSPDTLIETLEAIKLFLFVPRTAFLIGADERLVRYAVRRRFPELPGERAEVGRDYLEKLIQFPIRIPPMGRAEIETYVNLLFTSVSQIPSDQFEKVRNAVVNGSPDTLLEVRYNHGIAQSLLGSIPDGLAENLSLSARLSPVLAVGLSGNPRQCKRFLNTLVMRLEMAKSRKVALKQRVLAKLMLLEYFRPESFKQLAGLQAQHSGKSPDLAAVEHNLLPQLSANTPPPEKPPAKLHGQSKADVSQLATPKQQGPDVSASESLGQHLLDSWLSDAWLKDWITSDPILSSEDLRPYFYFARETLGPMGGSAQRMSPTAQEFLAELLNESDAVRGNAQRKAKDLSPVDAAAIFEALTERCRFDDDAGSETSALMAISAFTEARPDMFGQFLTLLHALPEATLPIQIVPKTIALAKSADQKATIRGLLNKWAVNSSNDPLKKAAQSRVKTLK